MSICISNRTIHELNSNENPSINDREREREKKLLPDQIGFPNIDWQEQLHQQQHVLCLKLTGNQMVLMPHTE